jgi:hypothetical protein
MSNQHSPRSTRTGRHLPALMAAAVIAGTSILALGAGSAARTGLEGTTPLGTTFQQPASPGEPIPITPLTGVTSLDATVVLNAAGTVDGKPTTGDLTAKLTTNDQAMSQIDVTGSLLGDVVSKVGGSAVKLFRPSKTSVYVVPEGAYAVVSGLFDVCVKAKDSSAIDALDQLSPQGLMTILTSSDVARGTFVGDEDLNGTPVKHYVINGEAFLAAAKASSDPTVNTFAQSLTSATDADLYVAADTGYPVAYRGGFSGTFEPLKFDGDLTVQIDVTGINDNTPVTLPGACDHPVSA